MRVHNHRRFCIDWVLVDELAIGPAPRAERHLQRLHDSGIKCILSLCSNAEALAAEGLEANLAEQFTCRRLVLPDHKAGRMPNPAELVAALDLLAEVKQQGPVFVHCVAAMERSPLVCMAWLIREHGLKPARALDYLMQVHPGTSPLPGQIGLLNHPDLAPNAPQSAQAL